MANWAKLQEELVGLPVYKRAKYGIHFRQSKNEFLANFSGAPCHHLDNGLWKPINTKLLLGDDGFYGCPHSPVKVHEDGRVKVGGSDYSQFTELPGSPIGKVDGDRIVREFPGGYQELFITEGGFREVITIEKPKFPLEKFIGKTSGTLPREYKASPQTAVDADGDTYEITEDTKAFGNWLDKVAYPVTIDPDFSLGNSNFGDTVLQDVSGSPYYRELNNYGIATVAPCASSVVILMRFDLSSIESTNTCLTASLFQTKVTHYENNWRAHVGYSLIEANSDWIEGTKNGTVAGSGEPCRNAKKADGSGGVTEAWDSGGAFGASDYETSTMFSYGFEGNLYDVGDPIEFEFNSNGIDVVQSWFGSINANYGFIKKNLQVYLHMAVAMSEYVTESYRPVLTVTYTSGGGLVTRKALLGVGI